MNITVIGTGYVGLVTGACLTQLGHSVMCIDNNHEKIELLKKGTLPIYEPHLTSLVTTAMQRKKMFFSTEISKGVTFGKVIFVTVGTPPKTSGEADLSLVEKVAIEIASSMKSYRVIVSKSTVPVETGEKIAHTIELYNKTHIPFDIVSNPEFLREGVAIHDFMHPDRIVIGASSERAKKVMREVYKKIKAPIIFTDIKSAELIKHAANSFLSLKISYINALSQICDRVGADVRQVADGMGHDKRIGRAFLDAGVGFGGSCFPKDLSAFITIADEIGYNFELLKVVQKINEEQKINFVKKIREAVWNLNEKTITVLGLAFKPNTDDIRSAPAIDIISLLLEEGATVRAYDPVAMNNAKKILGEKIVFGKTPYDSMQGSHALVVLTEWDEFKKLDMKKVKKLLHTPVIIDGRNMFDGEKLRAMGFVYKGVGC